MTTNTLESNSTIENMDNLNSTSLESLNPLYEKFINLLKSDVDKRLNLGQGETLYTIGDETWINFKKSAFNTCQTSKSITSLENFTKTNLSYEFNLLKTQICDPRNLTIQELRTKPNLKDLILRKNIKDLDFIEIRVAVIGNVDAGKSTVLGVLTHAELDNGRGYARQKMFRHRHEIESGRTSAIGNEILGFDSSGKVVNKPSHVTQSHPIKPAALKTLWQRICENSSKVISFIDLAGHEKYLKTTVYGMTGLLPDFCMLIVGANQGVVGMSKEHLGLALALNVPVFVVVTKIDMCPENILQNTMKTLKKILKSPACRKMPLVMQDLNDVVMSAHNFGGERICPIFKISNVTGENIDLLKQFLNMLTSRSTALKNVGNEINLEISEKLTEEEKEKVIFEQNKIEFLLDESYYVSGVGPVVSGTVLSGILREGCSLMFGPDSLGKFVNVDVRTLQRRRLPVTQATPGQSVAVAVRKIKRRDVRKGQVLISKSSLQEYQIKNDKNLPMFAAWEFIADVLILHHPTTISLKYQAMIHIGAIRQTGIIRWMDKDRLRTGMRAKVKFQFIKCPELIRIGQKFVFREGRTKAVGTVVECLPTIGVNVAARRHKNKVFRKEERMNSANATTVNA